MEALLARAGPLEASNGSSRRTGRGKGHSRPRDGPSGAGNGRSKVRPALPHQTVDRDLKPSASLGKIADKKLRAKLASQQLAHKRAYADRRDVQEYITGALPSTSSNKGLYEEEDETDIEGGEADSLEPEADRWHGTGIQVEEDLGEKTWRISQNEIVEAVDLASKNKKFELKMENIGGGGYRIDYTRNGRHLAIASNHGHTASFDWQAGKLHSEIQLNESVRDIKFLHSEAFYAVAQKKYVFIYDQEGVEVHKMKQHIDVTRMEFLPYHYLLATVGNAGHLKYHDTSTGLMIAEHKTRLGAVQSMAQNRHNAIIHLGHQNGQVTLWSPNLSTPHVKLLAHLGPIQSIAIDPSSSSCGRYMATSGADGKIKVWDSRNWGTTVREWSVRSSGLHEIAYSQKGMLAVGGRGGVHVYRDVDRGAKYPPTPYLQLPLPGLTPRQISFCPFEDVLGVGHSAGFSSLLVPGSGEPNFDSNEADVYESHSRKRERTVRTLLEKIQPDLITMDSNFLGRLGETAKKPYSDKETPYYQKSRQERLLVDGKAAQNGVGGLPSDEEGSDDDDTAGPGGSGMGQGAKQREKRKMRGKGKSLSRYLRKKRKNVIDPAMLAMKEKVEKQRADRDHAKKVASGEIRVQTGALARFGK